jgi:hypothetical protein
MQPALVEVAASAGIACSRNRHVVGLPEIALKRFFVDVESNTRFAAQVRVS